MTLRLLMPAGICACKAASPAGRMLAVLLGTHAVPADPGDDDHDPGCPASIFATGMGVKHPPGPPPIDLALLPAYLLDSTAEEPDFLAGFHSPVPAFSLRATTPDLYLTLCTLLI